MHSEPIDHPRPRLDFAATHAMYLAATGFSDARPSDIDLWARAIGRVDAAVLRELGREVRDPFPFVPLLRVVTALRLISDAPELEHAEAHLRVESQLLLDAMGFNLVRPDDVLRRIPPHVAMLRDVFAYPR